MVPSKHRRYWTTKTTTCSSFSCWPMTAEDFLTQAKITSLTYECYSETLTITTQCSWTLRTLSVSWKIRQTLWCIRLVKHIRYSKWPQSNLVDNIRKYEVSSHHTNVCKIPRLCRVMPSSKALWGDIPWWNFLLGVWPLRKDIPFCVTLNVTGA